ncbi:MAG: hypothetical protein DRG66_08325 [Deltaproteobacteria bacterium]|nr:MAG: hypothetical protein DRG66_08325 [Deltaproteobacteria bacterium]
MVLLVSELFFDDFKYLQRKRCITKCSKVKLGRSVPFNFKSKIWEPCLSYNGSEIQHGSQYLIQDSVSRPFL